MEETKEKTFIKASRFEIEQQLNQFIGNIKVDGLTDDGKISLIYLKIELSKQMEEISKFRKTTIDSIDKPKNFDKLKEKAEAKDATEDDKNAYKVVEKEYETKFSDIALPYFNEIVEMPFDFISEDDFKTIIKHNDLQVIFGYEYIYNKLVKK